MVEAFQITPIHRFHHGQADFTDDGVIVEQSVSLTVNGKIWLSFMCSPVDLEALAVGFLYNEKIISSTEEIIDIYICEHRDNIDIWLDRSVEEPTNWRRTSGCTGGFTAAVLDEVEPVPLNGVVITPNQILGLIRNLFEAQDIYKKSGGVHSSALSGKDKILFQIEDVGRHNTLDKIAGKIILENLNPQPKIILTTGRISSEMLQKSARMKTSILISRTSPTSMSVDLAQRLGITLIGYARGHRFNVYSHPERVDL
ncbi:MAG: formate dehydrogenase accessory sulfurtransferase FdhD [Aliifodinibius sp.]|nr:formate dehydrogenase accessory sulfurtransferase FdhD [Fodinibius sp.]